MPSHKFKRANHLSHSWLWKSLIPKMALSKGMSWANFPKPMVLNGMLFSLPTMPCERVLWHPPSLPPMKGLTATVPPLTNKSSHCNSSFPALLNSSLLPSLFSCPKAVTTFRNYGYNWLICVLPAPGFDLPFLTYINHLFPPCFHTKNGLLAP